MRELQYSPAVKMQMRGRPAPRNPAFFKRKPSADQPGPDPAHPNRLDEWLSRVPEFVFYGLGGAVICLIVLLTVLVARNILTVLA